MTIVMSKGREEKENKARVGVVVVVAMRSGDFGVR